MPFRRAHERREGEQQRLVSSRAFLTDHVGVGGVFSLLREPHAARGTFDGHGCRSVIVLSPLLFTTAFYSPLARAHNIYNAMSRAR